MSVFNSTKPGNMIARMGEGGMSRITSQIKDAIQDSASIFTRMIILDVIHDPQIIDSNKIDYWKNVIKVSNIRFANILPRNSVIARPATIGTTRISQPMFLFPFFPSHLALPCKPGEMVWTIFEDPNANIKEMGYWFCRITEPHFIDDVNHTHHPMQLDQSLNSSIKKKMEGQDKPVYELRNGKTQKTKEGTRLVIAESRLVQTDDEAVFEKLVTDSDAAQITQYESIPRFRKRPGDVAIEGSNNALIVLGTDRAAGAAYVSLDASAPSRGTTPDRTNDFFGSAGAIDIVTGRGMIPVTGGQTAATMRIADGQELKKELMKIPENLSPGEGDPDFSQDRSRVLVSQRTLVDTNFGLKSYMDQKFGGTVSEDASTGDACVVIKSDKVRIIARSDISFIVTNFENIPSTNSEQTIKSSATDVSSWASITIKRNGDIVFTPSDKGYIKLGGDDAKQAVLCTANPASANEGLVKSLPVATTAGGFIGTTGGNVDAAAIGLSNTPDLGTFSRKVLIK